MNRLSGGTFDETHVVVADDHPIVRKGLCHVIQEQPDLKVVGEAGDGATTLVLVESLRPRVAVVDLDMPKLDGFGVAMEIHRRQLQAEVIFLTIHTEVDLLQRAMDLGKGFVVKESALVDVVNGIRSVASGGCVREPVDDGGIVGPARAHQDLAGLQARHRRSHFRGTPDFGYDRRRQSDQGHRR